MALIKCNECGKEISDKASSCPNCGCPITAEKEDVIKNLDETTNTDKNSKKNKKSSLFIIIVVIAIVVLCGICLIFSNKETETSHTTSTEQSNSTETTLDKTTTAIDINKITSLDEIKTFAMNDVQNEINALTTEKEALILEINSYNLYKDNLKKVEDFYAKTLLTTENIGIKMREYSIVYAEFILNSDKSNDDKYDDLEEIYDVVYEDIGDMIYDEIYENTLDSLYDAFYDGILDDAYDTIEYKEWSDASSYAYDLWSDTGSDIYKAWSNATSDVYDFWSDVGSEIYGNDIEGANKEIQEFKDDINKLKNNDTKAVEETVNVPQTNNTVTPTSTENNSTEKNANTNNSTEKTKETSTNLVDGMRPEFKEAMDSYEEFMNDYCEFMKKYANSNGSDLSLLSDYADYMSKYSQFVSDFEKWDSDTEMNNKETLYYIDVQTRINKKLIEAAQ